MAGAEHKLVRSLLSPSAVLLLTPSPLRIEQYLDFGSVYAASFSETAQAKAQAPRVTRVCARYSRFFNAVA